MEQKNKNQQENPKIRTLEEVLEQQRKLKRWQAEVDSAKEAELGRPLEIWERPLKSLEEHQQMLQILAKRRKERGNK